MGLFKSFFKGSDESNQASVLPWLDLNKIEQLDAIAENSQSKTQMIFKHSTRCGVSRMVIAQFKKEYGFTEAQADLYYLDLLNHRDISQAIAERFHVVHESPQLLVIKNGEVVKYASHGGINDMALENLV